MLSDTARVGVAKLEARVRAEVTPPGRRLPCTSPPPLLASARFSLALPTYNSSRTVAELIRLAATAASISSAAIAVLAALWFACTSAWGTHQSGCAYPGE